MKLVVSPIGIVRCIYTEEIDLQIFGVPEIRRASHVEPDSQGNWTADLRPVGGPVLGSFARRSDALKAETDWIESNWLLTASD